MVILSDLAVEVELHDGSVALVNESHFQKFTQTCGLPTWSYGVGDLMIEKSIVIPSHHNIVHATFSLQSGAASRDFFFESEEQRGYAPHGSAWTPGYFDCELHLGSPVTFSGRLSMPGCAYTPETTTQRGIFSTALRRI